MIHRPVSGQGVQQTCIKFTGNAQVRNCSLYIVYALLGSLNYVICNSYTYKVACEFRL